jgi:hypothetical protein
MGLLGLAFSFSEARHGVSIWLAIGILAMLLVWFKHREILERDQGLAARLYGTIFALLIVILDLLRR